LSLYTAASSDLENPTKRLGSKNSGKWHRTCARASGPTFAAHPELVVIDVSLIFSFLSILSPHLYSVFNFFIYFWPYTRYPHYIIRCLK
jgi:hypothetical protein